MKEIDKMFKVKLTIYSSKAAKEFLSNIGSFKLAKEPD